MGAAFEHDPVASWFWRRARGRREYIEGWYRLVVEAHYLDHGEVFVAEMDGAIAGCSMWSPPGSWRLTPRAEMRATRYVARRLGLRLPIASIAMRRIEREHPDTPHWYLSELGVHPERQGRGLGSRLMFEVLNRCDREREPVYLEASTERSLALYARHGFRTEKVLHMPRGGPPLWLMWRPSGVPHEHAEGGHDRAAQGHLDERMRERHV